MTRDAYLPASSLDNNVFCILGVCLDFDLLPSARSIHGEAPYLRAVVVPYLLLVCIESDTLPNKVIAPGAPYIEWHLESDDQDPLIDLRCPLPQGMLTVVLQNTVSQPLLKLQN